MKINISDIIVPNAPAPSRGFVRSIEKHGQILSIILTPEDDKYRVIVGKRRVLAAIAAGQTTVEAEVKEMDSVHEAVTRLLENMQRSANPADEAEAMNHLLFHGYTADSIAEELGISKSKVQQRIRLLDLHPNLFAKLRNGALSARAGQIALSLSEAQQTELATRKDVTITEVEALRRSKQLTMLDVDSIDVPRIDENEILAARLSQIASSMATGWKKDALLAAIRALMSSKGVVVEEVYEYQVQG